jgi:hypothetical protein
LFDEVEFTVKLQQDDYLEVPRSAVFFQETWDTTKIQLIEEDSSTTTLSGPLWAPGESE